MTAIELEDYVENLLALDYSRCLGIKKVLKHNEKIISQKLEIVTDEKNRENLLIQQEKVLRKLRIVRKITNLKEIAVNKKNYKSDEEKIAKYNELESDFKKMMNEHSQLKSAHDDLKIKHSALKRQLANALAESKNESSN